MQDVNDDMDELLRRAANSYPLNTNSADWSRVADALRSSENVEDGDVEAPDGSSGKKKYRNLLLLFLLLTIPLLCVDYVLINGRLASGATTKMNKEVPEPKGIINRAKPAGEKSNQRVALFVKKNNGDKYPAFEGADKKRITNSNLKANEIPLSVLRAASKVTSKNTGLPSHENLYQSNGSPVTVGDNLENNYSKERENDVVAYKPELKTRGDLNDTFGGKVNKEVESTKETIFNKKKNKPAIYAGLLAGPDASTIKFQSVNKTGFSVGLVLGYAFSKKLTVETGVLWDKKFYYTDGKYFNPKNLSIPSFISIDDVDGSCSMIEAPVNVAYTIKSYHRSFLTANAGISSYFMKNENYSYTFQRSGVENEWNLAYKNSTINLFSVANIGAAYNHDLSKSFTLRIQPYIKIPISGIGMGRLPITSSGVYFVLSKRIK